MAIPVQDSGGSAILGQIRHSALLRSCRRPLFQPLWRILHRVALFGMNIGPAGSIEGSGEDWALRWCAKQPPAGEPFVLFDGGANFGQYATRALSIVGSRLRIFCFEPSPGSFERLAANLGETPGLRLMPFGLSETDAECELYSYLGGEGEASVVRRDMSHWGITQNRIEKVRLRRLDDVCREEGIKEIDFLKLDVEGHELQALRGAEGMLDARRIRFIQFEFGAPDIEGRTFFKDIYKLLNPNYRIYRIVYHGLAPIDVYGEVHEVFVTTNFLAVSRP